VGDGEKVEADHNIMGKLIFWAYERLIKFSVAPESNRAIALALFNLNCMKMCSIINFQFDINTSWSWYCLSSADLIRHLENPPLLLHTFV
jgi:hypothetical protein